MTESTIAATLEAAAAFDFSQALRETWELISALNKYIVAREPWVLAKTPESRPLLERDPVQRRRRAAGRGGADRAGDAGDRRADPRMLGTAGRVVGGPEGRHA